MAAVREGARNRTAGRLDTMRNARGVSDWLDALDAQYGDCDGYSVVGVIVNSRVACVR